MRFLLESPRAKVVVPGVLCLFAVTYSALALLEPLAAHFASRPTLSSLKRAVWLQPGNAEYRYFLGRYYSLVQPSPDEAAAAFRAAVSLNPHQARYWFALAGAYQLLGDLHGQSQALEQAVAAEPTTPDVAWEAANFHIVQGDADRARHELRTVLANDPTLVLSALQLCWRIDPDAASLMRDVLPPSPSVYSVFLEFLISRRKTEAAFQVWTRLAQFGQPVERRYVFEFVLYLAAQRQAGQARLVWQQAANLANLRAYQPSATNLVVNGDFSLPTLNAGLDWVYRKPQDVSIELDPTQFYSGHASLYLAFDSAGIEDAGIRQLIPVEPNTAYEFSGYYKADDMDGAGGIQLTLDDAYSVKTYFASDDLGNVDFWKQVRGAFTTAPDAQALILRLRRVPAGAPIKGRLWIDDLQLTPVRGEAAQ
jgi:tetratricopeptide (TPR) repeat protein